MASSHEKKEERLNLHIDSSYFIELDASARFMLVFLICVQTFNTCIECQPLLLNHSQ